MKLFKNLNFDKLKSGLDKTRNKIVDRISESISGKAKIDEDLLEELEEILITSDIGYDTSVDIIDKTRKDLKARKEREKVDVLSTIKEQLSSRLREYEKISTIEEDLEKYRPYVILVVGVNGAGKTCA